MVAEVRFYCAFFCVLVCDFELYHLVPSGPESQTSTLFKFCVFDFLSQLLNPFVDCKSSVCIMQMTPNTIVVDCSLYSSFLSQVQNSYDWPVRCPIFSSFYGVFVSVVLMIYLCSTYIHVSPHPNYVTSCMPRATYIYIVSSHLQSGALVLRYCSVCSIFRPLFLMSLHLVAPLVCTTDIDHHINAHG